MTNEEALAFLEKQQSKMTTYRHFYTEEAIETNALAIAAIKKQIPALLIKEVKKDYPAIMTTMYCPNCKHKYWEIYVTPELWKRESCRKIPYCVECGQKLMWEDENEILG